MKFEKVIGIIGQKAAGKSLAADHLRKQGFVVYKLSTPLREEARKQGFPAPTTKMLQDIGDQWRKKYGTGILAKKVLQHAYKNFHKKVVIDGLRNPGEIKEISKLTKNEALVLGITAFKKIRSKRLLGRGRPGDPNTYQEFLVLDNRDLGIGQVKSGQQVEACLEMMSKKNVLTNNKDKREFVRKLKKITKYADTVDPDCIEDSR